MNNQMCLYDVQRGNIHFITAQLSEMRARERAYQSWLGTGLLETSEYLRELQSYKVTQLTQPGDRIHLDITLSA